MALGKFFGSFRFSLYFIFHELHVIFFPREPLGTQENDTRGKDGKFEELF